MKRLLLIMPDYYGFDEVVFNGLKKYSNYEVLYINPIAKYKYKSIFEKILNFFTKNLFAYNIKTEKTKKSLYYNLINIEKIDMLIVNRPDLIDEKSIEILKKINIKERRVFYWDSFKKINQHKHFDFFNNKYSFDNHDCENYNLIKISNFFHVLEANITPIFDFYFIGTKDKRLKKFLELKNEIEKLNYTIGATIFDLNSNEKLENNIKYINKIINFSESYKEQCKGRIFIDIKQPDQVGLSFRPFEAMGLNKKIITDNLEIKKYDFYNKNNIFVLENNNYKDIINFLNKPYIQTPNNIKNKYFIKNWINEILK